jgi:hypothetical protein
MSAGQGFGDFAQSFINRINSDKNKFKGDMDALISSSVGELRDSFDTGLAEIREAYSSLSADVHSDADTLASTIESAIASIESTASKEKANVKKKLDQSVSYIKTHADKAVSDIAEVTDYVRTKAFDDFQLLVSTIKKDVERMKTEFDTTITKLSTKMITGVKEAVADIMSDARVGLTKIDEVKKKLGGDIETAEKDMKTKLEALKADAMKHFENISALIRKEAEKLEKRAEGVAKLINNMLTSIGLAALFISSAAAVTLIAYKFLRMPDNSSPRYIPPEERNFVYDPNASSDYSPIDTTSASSAVPKPSGQSPTSVSAMQSSVSPSTSASSTVPTSASAMQGPVSSLPIGQHPISSSTRTTNTSGLSAAHEAPGGTINRTHISAPSGSTVRVNDHSSQQGSSTHINNIPRRSPIRPVSNSRPRR